MLPLQSQWTDLFSARSPAKTNVGLSYNFSQKTSWFYLLLLSFFYYSFQVSKIFFGQQVCHCAFLLFIFRNIIFRSSILHVFFWKVLWSILSAFPSANVFGDKASGQFKVIWNGFFHPLPNLMFRIPNKCIFLSNAASFALGTTRRSGRTI